MTVGLTHPLYPQVFAPLARLLGLYSIKEELEERSFHFSEPENAAALRAQLDVMRSQQEAGVKSARARLQLLLDMDPYLASRVERIEVQTHSKALYSIWRYVLYHINPQSGG